MLIGPNGAGKTSVLHALARMLGVLIGPNAKAMRDPDDAARWLLPSALSPPNADDEGWATLRFAEYPPGHPTPHVDLEFGREIAGGVRVDQSQLLPFQQFAGASLFVAASLEPHLPLDQPLQPDRQFGILSNALATDWTTRADVDAKRSKKVHQWLLHQRLLDDVPQLWSSLEPFFGRRVHYIGVSPHDHDLYFQIGGDFVGFNDLSAGERKLVFLFATIVMHCKGEGVVLIDEPESHFHPEWQWKLRDALLALVPHGQVILATHSRDIIEGLDPHELFELQRVPANGKGEQSNP